ncbi:hypothetical protein RHSIM_Rhsim06G0053300 [Rhododendron simsii]|uniref:SPRY domain-containing protein n=1 Tax=Rhododendron simsii TaxID=118357 RepID=A0A834LKZ0_RHOSS|nr:hypothetical protein RHSIM_Rhsim06G0053300 [Rhododendron simsii]
MHEWLKITVAVVVAAAAVAAVGILILLVVLRRRLSLSKDTDSGATDSPPEIQDHKQIGIPKLTPRNLHNLDLDIRTRSNSYYVLKPEVSPAPRFNWADHPSLITDAVENGWSRFAFSPSHTSSSPSVRSTKSTLLGACAAGDRRESDVETSWEICPGSADFLQKIRLNSGLKKPSWCHSFIRTGLPLPGPQLGNSSFPQEAYFEITILENDFDYDPFGNRRRSSGKVEGERAKLIQENMNAKLNYSEWLVHVKNSGNGNNNGNRNFEELRGGGKEESSVMLTMGLFILMIMRHYPSYPSFYADENSLKSENAQYDERIKLIFKSEKAEWGKTDKVIGCGYNPNQRKVFFTVDSELVHVINCKSEEFDTPLYPTLASNIDTTVLVNFGQSVFKYAPANSQRTPNPCFISPPAKSPALSNEDSKELFSMGRIDCHSDETTKIVVMPHAFVVVGQDKGDRDSLEIQFNYASLE